MIHVPAVMEAMVAMVAMAVMAVAAAAVNHRRLTSPHYADPQRPNDSAGTPGNSGASAGNAGAAERISWMCPSPSLRD